jgi:hypothetical protein
MSNIMETKLSNKQMKYISKCFNEADGVSKKAPSRHGCVLVSGGKVIASGQNTPRCRVKNNRNILAIHAEHASIRGMSRFLRGIQEDRSICSSSISRQQVNRIKTLSTVC